MVCAVKIFYKCPICKRPIRLHRSYYKDCWYNKTQAHIQAKLTGLKMGFIEFSINLIFRKN